MKGDNTAKHLFSKGILEFIGSKTFEKYYIFYGKRI